MNRTMMDLRYRLERYTDRLPGKSKKRTLIMLGVLAALLVIVPAAYLIVYSGGGVDIPVQTGPNPQLAARNAWGAVFAELAGDNPAKTVQEAVRRAAEKLGADGMKCPVTGQPFLFNPELGDWVKGDKPPKSYVLLLSREGSGGNPPRICIGRGAMPMPTDGAEPEWASRAVTGG